MSDNNKKDKDLNETPETETNENNGTEEIVEVEQEIIQTNESGDDASSEEKKKSKEKKQKKSGNKIKDFFKWVAEQGIQVASIVVPLLANTVK